MTRIQYVLFALAVPAFLYAQKLSHPVMASRDDALLAAHPPVVLPDTVRVLAVMVQFQADNDTKTTGNGQFDLVQPPLPPIDAAPHDGPYFLDHLRFLQNYFLKASKAKLFIQPTLLDTIYTLPALIGCSTVGSPLSFH